MADEATYAIAGEIAFIRDYPPRGGKPYGSIGIKVCLPDEAVLLSGNQFMARGHVAFVWINYGERDLEKPQLVDIRRLTERDSILVRGNLKVKPDKRDGDKLKLVLDTRISGARAVPAGTFLNKVTLVGDLVRSTPKYLTVKTSYMNPKSKEWKDRLFSVVAPDGVTPPEAHNLGHQKVLVLGRLFGEFPDGQKDLWIAAETVL